MFLTQKIDTATSNVRVAVGCQRYLHLNRVTKFIDTILKIEVHL
jgi:hypothetical protein